MATLSFDWIARVITVMDPDVGVTVQDLINQIRDAEDELVNMDDPIIAKATGKDTLGVGVTTAITLELLNNWQLAFEARPGPTFVQCTVGGGNLIGGIAGNPIKATAYTQVLNILSAAATIVAGALAPQEMRDAMKLAPSAGTPAAGSVDDNMKKIKANTNLIPAAL